MANQDPNQDPNPASAPDGMEPSGVEQSGVDRSGMDSGSGFQDTASAPLDLPEAPARRRWFSRRPSPAAVDPAPGESDKWDSSAARELGSFRGVPVVGALPWRTQYLALGGVLAVSVLVLAASLFSRPSVGGAPAAAIESAAQVRALALTATTGSRVDPAALLSATQSLQAGPDTSAWRALQSAAQSWQQAEQQWDPLAAAAAQAAASLQQGSASVQGAWPAIAAQSTVALPEAVGLARLVGAYDTLVAKLAALASGEADAGPIEPEVALSTEAFQEFKQSDLLTRRDLALTRAWLDASAAWGTATPGLTQLAQATPHAVLATREQALIALAQADAAWLSSLPTGASSRPGLLAMLAIPLALGSLALLLMVAWRHRQYQDLSVRAIVEQTDAALVQIGQDLGLVAEGDLTRQVRVPDSPVGVIAQAINRMIEQLRQIVAQAKQAAAEASSTSVQAVDAAVELIDGHRARLATVEEQAQDALGLVEGVGQAAAQARVSSQLAASSHQAAQSGRLAAVDLQDHMRGAKERVEEASGRTQRLVASSKEIAGMASMLKELAEQLEILGMQAALQASKAGDSGQGFRVVARSIQELSEDSGTNARKVSALVETAQSDLEALAASVRGAASSVEEGSRLAAAAHQGWGQVADSLQGLAASTASMDEAAQEQLRQASSVDDHTRREVGAVAPESARAQQASDALVKMVASVRAMGEAMARLKA